MTILRSPWHKTKNAISPSLQACMVLQGSCPLHSDSEIKLLLYWWICYLNVKLMNLPQQGK